MLQHRFLSKKTASFFYFAVFVLLFCGANVLHEIGWNIDYYASPTYQKIRPEFYLLFFIVILWWNKIYKSCIEFKIQYLSVFVLFYWIILGQSNGFAVLFNTIVLPVIISLLLNYTNKKQRHVIVYIILSFYIINSLIAIYERISGSLIFGYYSGGDTFVSDTMEDLFLFRSTALRNHPLGNALLTSVILAFIMISNQIKVKYKFLLFLLGFLAIMSFNARSSIMIVIGLTSLYLLYNLLIKRVTNISRTNIFLITLTCAVVIVYFFSNGWGGRILVKGNLEDSSVEARILIYERFLNSDLSTFLIGMSNEQISAWAKLSHIESFWILYLCRFGIFIFVYYICLFYKLLKQWIVQYKFINALYVTSLFLLISSINNSIYSGDPVIAVFILCAATFNDIKIDKECRYVYKQI